MRRSTAPLSTPYALIGAFIVLAAVILTTAGMLYARQRHGVKELRYKDLQAIAELISSRIEQWRSARVEVAQSAALVCACSVAHAGMPVAGSRSHAQMSAMLRSLTDVDGHAAVHFLDPVGRPIVHADRGPCALETLSDESDRSAAALAAAAIKARAPVWSGLHTHGSDTHCLAVAFPVVAPDGRTLGSVILTNAALDLFRLGEGWQMPTKTMEVLLLMPADGAMVRMRTGGGPPPPAGPRPEPCDQGDIMIEQALSGRVGHLRGPVSGRAEMYGHIRPVTGADWLLVVREDAEEANAPTRTLTALWSVIALACVGAALGGLLAIWRHQRAHEYRRLYEAEIERHRAEREAFQSRAMLELVLNTVPQRIFWKDRESRYLGCNLAFALDAGHRTPDELRGRDDYEMSWKENADLYRNDDRTVMESGEPRLNYVEPQSRADGTFAWLRTSKVPLRDDEGNVVGVLGTYEDITALVEAREELEHKNRELTGVLSAVSHDLRSPLVSLTGYVAEIGASLKALQESLREVPLPPEVAQTVTEILERTMPGDLGVISANAERMNHLLDGALTISRIGRMPLSIQTLRMNDLVGSVVTSHMRRASELGATIEVGNLPNCEGDPVQITRVFDNLIGNALKYLDPARPGQIKISGEVRQGNAVYCVEDNGIGIRPEDHERIFELFQRVDRTLTEGEGLGLTTVRTIVARHGGRVWVESDPGAGSRFFVRLPRKSGTSERR